MTGTLGDIFGDKNKIDMVLALLSKGSLKKTDLYSYTTYNNLNPRKLDELEQDGIVTQTVDRFQNNMTTVALTDLGREVARKLQEIEGLMSGETAPGDVMTDYGASQTLFPMNQDVKHGR